MYIKSFDSFLNEATLLNSAPAHHLGVFAWNDYLKMDDRQIPIFFDSLRSSLGAKDVKVANYGGAYMLPDRNHAAVVSIGDKLKLFIRNGYLLGYNTDTDGDPRTITQEPLELPRSIDSYEKLAAFPKMLKTKGKTLNGVNTKTKIHMPAVFKDGTMVWHDENGERHRENGPALIGPYIAGMWFKHGKLHRTDGPAKIWRDGTESWYINDKSFTKDEFDAYKGRK